MDTIVIEGRKKNPHHRLILINNDVSMPYLSTTCIHK